MKVCVFNRSYWPDHGATGQLLTQLCEDLVARHGMQVTVVCGEAPGPARRGHGLIRREVRNGVEILRARGTAFDKSRFAGRVANYLSYFFSAWCAARRAGRPDVVVALTDPPIIGLAALRAARRAGARFVYVCQDLFPEVTRLVEDFRSPVVDWALDLVGRALLARADRVVAVGETMRDRLVEGKGAEPTRVAVIHNWADCAALTPRPKDNPFAREHGLAEPFVVMHSGNVGLSQNLDTFVDAAARLREERGIVWVIMGDGARRVPLQARVRALGLEGQVRFLASQPAERLADAFGSADAFVIGLRQGLAGCIVPSKLYGILAAGRPYIAAVEPACEVASVTFKHDCGLLAPPGDSAVLAARVLELYRDRPLARHLGANARRASESFDRPAQVDAYARVLREAASESRPVGDWRLKRAFDVALSGLGLLVSTPLWALIAVCIKADDGGAVFFGQERVGRGGRRFRSLKFRSMVADAERFGPIQAVQGDRRVTRVGQWLRASAMDELPQLWNIFTGDMSFVGPRALVPAEVETGAGGVLGRLEDVPGYARRHRVRPGLTGIAQVFAARDVPRRRKFRYDLLYISRRSFWLDLKLIALSFWITGLGRWDKRGPKL